MANSLLGRVARCQRGIARLEGERETLRERVRALPSGLLRAELARDLERLGERICNRRAYEKRLMLD
jgi:hypothetical protein